MIHIDAFGPWIICKFLFRKTLDTMSNISSQYFLLHVSVVLCYILQAIELFPALDTLCTTNLLATCYSTYEETNTVQNMHLGPAAHNAFVYANIIMRLGYAIMRLLLTVHWIS